MTGRNLIVLVLVLVLVLESFWVDRARHRIFLKVWKAVVTTQSVAIIRRMARRVHYRWE
jgi:hypothetical protein